METETRSIFTTIELILGVIPPTRIDFKSDLEKVKHTASFTAPEAMGDRWQQLAEVINFYINPESVLHYQWKALAAAIFTNRSVEEIVQHAREHRV